MRYSNFAAFMAGASALVLASAAHAQTDPVNPGTAADRANSAAEAATDETGNQEIVVTARLQAERAIDVPATVTGLSSTDLQERNILSLDDIGSVIPGLNLVPSTSGPNALATFRGVRFDAGAQAANTVTAYIDEVPTNLFQLFNSLYDVGNLEVLRGPQGTLRGSSSPSGAIGLVTRRPDLDTIGGYASATVTLPRGVNVQGAVGVPLIRDVLAIRVAGALNRTAANNVESVNNPTKPFSEGKNFRATLLFRPTSNFEATLIYRHDRLETQQYSSAVFGPGAPGVPFFPSLELVPSVPGLLTTPAFTIPAGFNGPALSQSQDKSVQATRPDRQLFNTDSITLQLGWSIAGQKLLYVGNRTWTDIDQTPLGGDVFNAIPTSPSRGYFLQSFDYRSHEVRLSSEEPIAGLFDYTVGYYHSRVPLTADYAVDNLFALNGAFGSPLAVNSPLTVNRDYIVAADFAQRYKSSEDSIFANVNVHLGESTELSLGGRQLWTGVSVASPSSVRDTFAAIPFAGPCTGTASGFTLLGAYTNAPLSPSPYAGTCNVQLSPGNGLFSITNFPLTKLKNDNFVWLGSLSHKFTPDLMAYATVGTAVRDGPAVVGAPSCAACGPYNFLDGEKSTSYELGLKGKIFDNRLTFSIAVFQQDFDNYIASAPGTPYLDSAGSVSTGTFAFNGPMRTRGVDLELDYRASPDLLIGAAFSYARGRFKNADIPCRDSNFDGVPDGGALPATGAEWIAGGGPASGPAVCNTNGPIASTPPWNLILNGEYSRDAFEDARAFLRWTFNYTPKNTNATLTNPGFVPKAYGLLDLFGGVRSSDGRWEVSAAVRNLFNTRTVLFEGTADGLLGQYPFALAGASTGYRTYGRVPERSFQLSVRYAFGSR